MRLTKILLGLWLSVALAGCMTLPAASPSPTIPATRISPQDQSSPSTASTPVSQTPTPGPLTLVYWEEESGDGDVLLDELAAEFMQDNPGIVVERAHYRYEELSLLFRATAQTGEGPDLVRAPGEFTEPFAALGVVEPASELYDATTLNRFLTGALEAATVDEVLWGLPDNYGDSLVLIYNKDLVAELPDNTDAWIARLESLTDRETGRYGLVYDQQEPYWVVPWIGGFGGWPIDDQGNPTLDTAAVEDALHFVQDLKLVHRVLPDAGDYETAFTLFRTGQAATIIDGRWNLDHYLGSDLNLGIASLPTVSATGQRPSPMAAGKHWFVSSQTTPDHREAALRFVDFMTSAHAQELWLTRMGRLPSNRETLQLARDDTNALLAGAAGQLLHARGLPPAQAMPCVWRAMAPALEPLMDGTSSPKAAAETMQSGAEACMKELSDVFTPVPTE